MTNWVGFGSPINNYIMKKIHSIMYYSACAVGYTCVAMLCVMMSCGPTTWFMYTFMCTAVLFCVLTTIAWLTGTRK